MVGHILLSACKVVFFSTFPPFWDFFPIFPQKLSPLNRKNDEKGEKRLLCRPIAKYALPWPLLSFPRRTFWYLKQENRLRKKTMSGFWDFSRIFPQKLSPPKTVPCQKPRFLMKFRHWFLDSPFLNRFSWLRYQNVRLEKLTLFRTGGGCIFFAKSAIHPQTPAGWWVD